MALKLNDRIKEINDKLSDGTGGEIASFASQVTTGLDNAKSSLNNVSLSAADSWQDIVCNRTINIIQSISSKIDRGKQSAEIAESAASSVNSLKAQADAYIKAYEAYRSSEYYNDSPPSGLKNKDSWYSAKRNTENNVQSLEDAAIAAESAVKAAFSDSQTSAMASESLDANSVTLSGAELTEFCTKNYIDKDKVTVKKTTVNINGVDFTLYTVYDNNLASREFETLAFQEYIKSSIDNLGKIDQEVLKNTSSTDLIFEQTYSCDTGHSNFHMDGVAQAWYISGNNTITSWFPQFASYEYGTNSIIHEFGHAVDSAIGNNATGSYYNYQTEEIDGETWTNLIKKEGQSFKNSGIPGLCGAYDINDYLESQSEYLAEVFYAYYSSDENRQRLEYSAPETYKELEKLITKAKNMG